MPVVTDGSGGNLNKTGVLIDCKGGGRAETTPAVDGIVELAVRVCV